METQKDSRFLTFRPQQSFADYHAAAGVQYQTPVERFLYWYDNTTHCCCIE